MKFLKVTEGKNITYYKAKSFDVKNGNIDNIVEEKPIIKGKIYYSNIPTTWMIVNKTTKIQEISKKEYKAINPFKQNR
jgi:hypothetical protein